MASESTPGRQRLELARAEAYRGHPGRKRTPLRYELITCPGRDTGDVPVNGLGIEWPGLRT